MEFTGKKGFLKTGSVVALIGLSLSAQSTLSLVGVGLIVIGLAIVLVGMLRVD